MSRFSYSVAKNFSVIFLFVTFFALCVSQDLVKHNTSLVSWYSLFLEIAYNLSRLLLVVAAVNFSWIIVAFSHSISIIFGSRHALAQAILSPQLNNFLGICQQDAPNTKAIHSSKAVGEPPFFLGSAVLFAIKNAIKSARAEAGYSDWFPLDNPATPERIRMACTDEFTKLLVESDFRPKLSVWWLNYTAKVKGLELLVCPLYIFL